MAFTVTQNVILDGSRKCVIKLHLVSDATAEATNQILVDASDLNPGNNVLVIEAINAELRGFSADLHWKADTNVDILTIPAEGQFIADYKPIGCLQNNAGPGRNGDILFTTTGGTAGDEGTIVLELKKKAL